MGKHKRTEGSLKKIEEIKTRVENEFLLDDYSKGGLDGTYGEYLELVIQYGYMVLFGLAFPLAILLAAVNNIFEIQVDKYKLVSLVRRPIPQGAASIGIHSQYIYIYIYRNLGKYPKYNKFHWGNIKRRTYYIDTTYDRQRKHKIYDIHRINNPTVNIEIFNRCGHSRYSNLHYNS